MCLSCLSTATKPVVKKKQMFKCLLFSYTEITVLKSSLCCAPLSLYRALHNLPNASGERSDAVPLHSVFHVPSRISVQVINAKVGENAALPV